MDKITLDKIALEDGTLAVSSVENRVTGGIDHVIIGKYVTGAAKGKEGFRMFYHASADQTDFCATEYAANNLKVSTESKGYDIRLRKENLIETIKKAAQHLGISENR